MADVVLCAIFKNEADYLYEWLSFHDFVGIRHFYLYNNNSTDNSLEIIDSWPHRDRVTVLEWPDVPGQITAYRHMISVNRKAGEWCAFIDCDEFLCPQGADTLGLTLDRFAAQCGALYVHWLMFGSSGEVEQREGLVTERFTRRGYDSYPAHHIGKSIVKLADAKEVGFCHIIRSNGRMLNVAGEEIDQAGNGIHSGYSHRLFAVNHYYTKSWDEWKRRRAQGKADKPLDAPDFRRTDDDFHRNDQNVQMDLKAFRITQLMKPIYYPTAASIVSTPWAGSLWT
jgi:glycosyltransferase involved in cell wall biosynthesis